MLFRFNSRVADDAQNDKQRAAQVAFLSHLSVGSSYAE